MNPFGISRPAGSCRPGLSSKELNRLAAQNRAQKARELVAFKLAVDLLAIETNESLALMDAKLGRRRPARNSTKPRMAAMRPKLERLRAADAQRSKTPLLDAARAKLERLYAADAKPRMAAMQVKLARLRARSAQQDRLLL